MAHRTASQTLALKFIRAIPYECGYADAIESCFGPNEDDGSPWEEYARAFCYLKGYADACRLACVYMTREYEIAKLVSGACGTINACISRASEEGDPILREAMIHVWLAELNVYASWRIGASHGEQPFFRSDRPGLTKTEPKPFVSPIPKASGT